MRLGEMRRHPSYACLQSAKKWYTKKMMNDKTKLVKKAKNGKASRCCWSAYQKRLCKMGLGEMRLGKMLPNRFSRWEHQACMHSMMTDLHRLYIGSYESK